METDHFEIVYSQFHGECSIREIERLRAVSTDCDVIIGLGGGKALDTAKTISYLDKKPVIVVPTIASTDAPCSSLAVIYSDEGVFERYMFFTKNPDLVLVDSGVIANAPVRFLVAGMGDALSTYFEARACARSNANNIPGGKSTLAALAIAKLCYETLLEDSVKAKAACEAKVVTKALENIIEANILLSGLGFESSGLAAAHAVHDGLTALEETHHYWHGEKVAFGTIVHLVLENAPMEELTTVVTYCKSVGLPTCLKDLGIKEATPEKIMKVAKCATAEGDTMHNMPFPVTAENVYAAILTADKLGATL
jgi:glycerol dehydrogenase